MRYCKKCLEPDTRPDAEFDAEGVCMPCRYLERTGDIDWVARRRELEKIAAWAKTQNRSGYDCIIPVSGGKDSLRQSLYCRDELGLKPLLVSCAYPPEEQTERGAQNMANLISLGFDCIYVSPAPQTWKRAMLTGFSKFGNIHKSTELPLLASVPRVAIAFHIPLVVYGENPALSWGGNAGSHDGNANRLKYTNTLQGGDKSWMEPEVAPPHHLYWYTYPSDDEIVRAGLRMIYLGYFMPDFNDFENARIAIENGLVCREGDDFIPGEVGQIHNFDALDCDFVIVNQMLKALKFGFGKASEQCSAAIRANKMTREEAVTLARLYDGKCGDRYIRRFCNFVGISEDEFWEVAESYRNKNLWEKEGNSWRLKYPLT